MVCRRAFVGIVVFALGCGEIPQHSTPKSPAERVDEILREVVDPKGPGVGVLVLRNGQVLYRKGLGQANLEHRIPVTAKTVFDLASCSKAFTAMAIMILADRGRLAFDDDVRRFLPKLPEYHRGRPVRIDDLLHHTSGIRDYLGLLEKVKGDPGRIKNKDVLKLLAKQKLEFPTGTRFSYSNSNYCLLALIIERVSGLSYGQFLRREIFEPLGMKSSHVYEDTRQVVANRAYGYGKSDNGYSWSHSDLVTTGDGGVMATMDDLAIWDRALREARLVKPEIVQRAFTPGKLDSGEEQDYGFGWALTRGEGKRIASHSGGWYGTSTYVERGLDDAVTVIVLSNDERFESVTIGRRISRIFREKN